MRLFGKKSSLDISSGDTGKKKKKLEKEKEGQWKKLCISVYYNKICLMLQMFIIVFTSTSDTFNSSIP